MMIDLKALEIELRQARLARISTQREGCSLDELIALMRQPWRASARLDLAMRSKNPDEPLPN